MLVDFARTLWNLQREKVDTFLDNGFNGYKWKQKIQIKTVCHY